ncbi:MAG TPA: M20 family metallopeptidase [Thermomicrobiales bacterium]|nr:M20 family metallopeptidase [Thermomicrobiales bacterium]
MTQAIVEAARERHPATVDLLKRIVSFESPSNEKQAVDALVDYLEQQIVARRGRVERLAQDEWGDLLVARFAGDDAARRPLLVMTHIDTVWPLRTIERLPWTIDGDRATGPGIYDMKASVAMMLSALDVLRGLSATRRPVVWLINTEEEVGSPVSRPVIERLALESEIVLCLEPPVPPHGSLKTQRKGVGMFTMTIEGRASHAGADHQAGVSAIEELARQVQWLHGLTDYERGTTVNVGVVTGGTKRNVVAASAEALIDLRVTTMSETDGVVAKILNAAPVLKGTTVSVSGGLNRPPMERTPAIVEAFERAREVGKSIGQDLTEASTGGGSDGNFTAAVGATTIDGLGCLGDGGHAETEHILLSGLRDRTALLTALLAQL